ARDVEWKLSFRAASTRRWKRGPNAVRRAKMGLSPFWLAKALVKRVISMLPVSPAGPWAWTSVKLQVADCVRPGGKAFPPGALAPFFSAPRQCFLAASLFP